MVKFAAREFQRETGRLLRRERQYEGLSQETLAKKIGIGRSVLANIESGRQRIPVDVLWRAGVVLKLDVSAFLPESQRTK
jgi:transcriptional regulator with XRE-family HTH domain